MSMMIGRSQVMDDLRSRILRVADTTFTVLVEGESGVGKELVARQIHTCSRRYRGPLVAVNCAALVESLVEAELFGIEERTATGVRGRRGKFELADQGTLFLDEVGDLSPTAQAKLLRVLQDMAVERVGGSGTIRVDTRVVAATNRNLRAMVETGKFRADLYYRLAGVEIGVPPLRARREDVPLLVEHFLSRHRAAPPFEVSAAAMEALVAYSWPGNVRQLQRTIERIVALSSSSLIELADLPRELTDGYRDLTACEMEQDESLKAWTSRYVRLVLDRCEGNKRRACDVLDISYHTLRTYLKYEARSFAKRRVPPPLPDGYEEMTSGAA